MSIQASNDPQTQTTQSQPAPQQEISFSEFEALRRAGKPIVATKESAPVAKATEQKAATESDAEEQEAKGEESDEESQLESADDEGKDDASQKDKPKKQGGFQRRIGKLTAEKSEARREAEYWKRVALEKQAAGEPKPEPKVDTTPAASEGKPNPDNYDTHAEYVEAVVEWKAEQKLRERDQMLEKNKLQAEHERLRTAHMERVKSFSEKTEDFAEVIESVDNIPVSPTVAELIVSSENGPALMYALAKNPEEYERINSLSPLAAAREIGRIETRIQASAQESKPEPKKLTKAPKPIDPVGGSKSTVAKSIDDPELSFSEYERLRREQQNRKRR